VKIALVSQALTPQYGGSAFSEASLAGSLLAGDNDVVVFCRNGCSDADFVGRFGKIEVQSYRPLQWVWAWLNKNHALRRAIRDADLLHLNGHWRWENYFIARVCVVEKKPYILQPRGMLWLGHRKIWLKKVFQRFVGKYVIRHASRVIALSKFELSHWEGYGFPNDQIEVLPNGVLGVGESKKDQAPEDLPLAPHGYFLYLGRLESRKNLVFLIQCFYSYRRRGGKAELWLVGPAERNYDAVLRDAILRMGMTAHVRLLPPVFTEGKKAILAGALALVYPAIEEPFGRVPFEALEAGCRPIVPRRSGSAEYIRPFLPEMIYEDTSPESLLSVLRQAEKPSPSQQLQLDKACQWVRRELHWERVVQRYEDVYRTVLKNPTRASDRGRDDLRST
jgi:glycosyltransferase involved in cell wall biosynthesis